MIFDWHDLIGTIGVILIVFAYAAIQFSWLTPESVVYSATNGLGALLILISLLFEFNFSAFLMELVWLALSVYGLQRSMRPAKTESRAR